MRSKPFILIVDDDPLNATLLAEYFDSDTYGIRVANHGQECLQVLDETPPDLILLDIMMPEINGYEVCRRIRKHPACQNTAVLFITALSDRKDKVRGFEAGAVDYITKPFDMLEVRARVETHLALKKARDALLNQNEILESKVKTRTAELERTNARLKHEITARKRTLENLELSEAKTRAIIEALPDGVIHLSSDGQIIYGKGLESLGTTSEAPIEEQNLDHILSADIASQFQAQIAKTLKTRQNGFLEFQLAPNGSDRFFEARLIITSSESVLAIIRDITDIKRQQDLQRAREARLRQENIHLRSSIKERYRFGDIIGKSPIMQEVYNLIIKAAESDAGVIINGESGTGKELVAKAIHQMSSRSGHHFVPVNCGAIADSLMESEFFGYKKGAFSGADTDKAGFLDEAENGTLFLDEVGDIGLGLQVKLLRIIDGYGFTPVGSQRVKKTNVRFMAASNKDLAQLVKAGQLREDFFYRIQIVPINLPPLRERREDIPLLIDHFLNRYAKGLQSVPTIAGKVYESLLNYDWPGNVRELQNTIQRYVALNKIDFVATPNETPSGADIALPDGEIDYQNYLAAIESFEKKMLRHALARNCWHKEKTAADLGIPRRTFYRKLKKLGLNSAQKVPDMAPSRNP